jgi:ABC-type nitrate/sulfonate/bicarbonate transport system substrate-binding protein
MNSRRRGFAVALLGLVFLMGGNAGVAQTPEVVRIATLPIDAEAQPLYAKELGLFKKAGLDATVTIVHNAAAIASATLGGTFDVGFTDLTTLALAHEKGLPLVAIAPGALYLSSAPTTVCVVTKNSPVKAAKDLNGSTIGVTGLFSFTRIVFSAWLDQNGADLSSIKFIELPFSEVPAALVARRITAGTLSNPYLQTAVDAGEVRVLSKCADAIAPKLLITAFFSTSDFAKTHPDIVKKVAAVMAEAARWGNTHQSESAAILKKWTKLEVTPDMARATYADEFSIPQVQPQIDAAVRYKILKTSFPATNLFAPGVRAVP